MTEYEYDSIFWVTNLFTQNGNEILPIAWWWYWFILQIIIQILYSLMCRNKSIIKNTSIEKIKMERQFCHPLSIGYSHRGVMVTFKTWTDVYHRLRLTSSPVVTFWTDRSSFSTMRRIDLMTSSYSRRLREIRALFWPSNAPSKNPES